MSTCNTIHTAHMTHTQSNKNTVLSMNVAAAESWYPRKHPSLAYPPPHILSILTRLPQPETILAQKIYALNKAQLNKADFHTLPVSREST